MLAIGPALYAVYTYVQFIVGPEYQRYAGNNEKAFPLYLGLIILGWVVAVRAWSEIGARIMPSPTDQLRRGLASTLIILGLFFALTWLRGIADVLRGTQVTEYQQDPTLFWLIRLMDLGFVIPAALITGAGLLSGKAWATRMSYAVSGFLMLEIGAVAAMVIAMVLRSDPAASVPILIVTLTSTLTLAAFYLQLLRASGEESRSRRSHVRLRATNERAG